MVNRSKKFNVLERFMRNTCNSSSMISSIVIMPTASSPSGITESRTSSICRMFASAYLNHFLPLDGALYEFLELLGRLMQFWRPFFPSNSSIEDPFHHPCLYSPLLLYFERQRGGLHTKGYSWGKWTDKFTKQDENNQF